MSKRALQRVRSAGWRGGVTGASVALLLITVAWTYPALARQGTLTHAQGPNLGTWTFGSIELQLAANGGGGAGTYVWSVAPGSTLPPGMALRSDVPEWFAPNADAGLIGVATTPGNYTFTLIVTSGSQSVSQTYTWGISALSIQDTNIPEGFVGKPYSHQFTAINAQGPVTYTASSLPVDYTLSSGGLLEGVPPTTGTLNVTFQVTDGFTTSYQARTINVYDIDIPTDGALPNATPGVPYAATIEAAGGTPPYVFTACPGSTLGVGCVPGLQSLPTGLTLASDGVISGTPTSGPAHNRITVTVTDANNVSYSKLMAITVSGHPVTLPSISANFDDCTIGSWCNLGVYVFGGAGAPYTWSASNLPPGMSIRSGSRVASYWMHPNDAEIWGLPSQLGAFDVELTAEDKDGNSVTNTFRMNVSPLLLRDFFENGTRDVPYSSRLRVIGGQVNSTGPMYDTTHIGGRFAAGLSFDSDTLTLSGTPVENGQYTYSFDPLFRFVDAAGRTLTKRSYFGISADTSTIVITTGPNLGTRSPGSSQSLIFTACCVPSSLTWSHAGGTLPPGMSLSSSGTLSGVPTTEGTYDFLIEAADATNPANVGVKSFTLVITSLSVSFASSLPSYSNVGNGIDLQLSATGGTGPYTWRFGATTPPPPGLQIDPATGRLSGTLEHSGQFSFSVEVEDALGAVVSRFFSIAIYPPGEHPPLNLSIFSSSLPIALGQQLVQLTTTGGVPPYSYSFTPGAPEIPGMRLQDGQPLPTYFTATGGYLGVLAESGTFSTSIRVTDSAGETFDRAVTFAVASVQPSSLPPPAAVVGEAYTYAFAADGGSGQYSWSLAPGSLPLPPGLALGASGALSGTPTVPGSYSFNLRVTDVVTGDFMQWFYNLQVNAFAITTGAVLPIGRIGDPYEVAFEAPACGSACSWSTSFLPVGLTLTTDGVLSGTPVGLVDSSIAVTVSGSNGTVRQTFALQVVSTTPRPLVLTTTSVGPTVIGSFATTRLFAQGGTPPYTWTVDSGSLPRGVELTSGVGVNNLTGPSLAGRPVELGEFDFELRVADSLGATSTAPYSWNITPLSPQYFSLPLTVGFGASQTIPNPLVYNEPFTQPLLVVGGTGSYTFTNITSMPPGLSLSSDGVVTGTPGNTGSFSTRIQVTDTEGHWNQWTLNVNISGPTSTTLGFNSGPALGTYSQGFTRTFDVTPYGGTGEYSVTPVGPLPDGFVLQSGDSLLNDAAGSFLVTGIPITTGPQNFTLRAEDSAGNIGVRTFNFSITSVTPFSSGTLADASVSTPFEQPLIAFDSGGGVTWTVAFGSSLPPGMSLSPAGVISGTPTAAGDYFFTLASTDSNGIPLFSSFSMRVSHMRIDDEPILPLATLGEEYSYAFSGTAGVWTASGLPEGMAMSADGTISGTPTATGTFTVNVTLTDGVVPFARRFTLFVRHNNPAVLHIATASLADLTAGLSTGITLAASGGVPLLQWSVASGALPPGMQLIVTGTNLPHYQPGTTLLAGVPTVPGLYAFELELTDGAGASTTRAFTLNVSPLHIPMSGTQQATAGSPYVRQFSTVGGTPPYTYSIRPTSLTRDALPPGFSLSAAGVLSGTTNSTGWYVFELQATDAAGNTFARALDLTVENTFGLLVTNGNPSDSLVGRGRQNVQLQTNGTSTYSWTLQAGMLPPGISLVSTDGITTSLRGVPTQPGTFEFTLRATDTANAGNFADHAFTYRVGTTQLVDPPVQFLTLLDLPSGEVGVPYSFPFKLAGGTPPYAFELSPFDTLPPGLTLTTTGLLVGTPTAAGSFSIQPIITDAAGFTVNGPSMTLIISPSGRAAPFIAVGVNALLEGSVGAPYISSFIERAATLRGGIQPFTLAVAAGSTLPPGLVILAGGNGISDRIGGVPTVAGDYSFSLEITDRDGQSMTLPLTQKISGLALTPATVPAARVGVPYSVSLAPNGGLPPYTLLLGPTSDMPPGLTLNSAGLLSGTPTAPGNFRVHVLLSDGSGDSLATFYYLTVDDAAGQSPAIEIAPRPVQAFFQTGTSAPVIPVNVGSTSGNLAFQAVVSGIAGATLSADNGTTPVTLQLNLPPLAAGTYSGVIAVTSSAAANSYDAVPLTVTSSSPPPCVITLDPPTSTIAVAGGSGSFDVLTAPGCSWNASLPPASVITVNGAKSGTGPGTVSYTVPKNTGLNSRTFNITVGTQVHAIMQFGPECSFATSLAKIFATAAGGEAVIAITPGLDDASCVWTTSSASLAFVPSTGGPADQSTVVTIPPNPNAGSRQLTAMVAGRSLVVNQAGAECTVALSPYSASMAASGGSGGVQVTIPVGCTYESTSGANWINVVSGGAGSTSGTLLYEVEANTVAVPRTAAITIGGQTVQITQDALPCSVTINTSGLGSPFGAAGGAGIIGVTANGPGCEWTASSSVPWASVSASSGAGNGHIGVTLLSNASSTEERSGELSIAGQTVLITQAGTACTYALQSATGTAPASGGSGAVGVIAVSACSWSATSNDPDWLTITAAGSGGVGEVRFNALANPSPDPRSGTLTIAGLAYTVTQAGSPCAYLLPSDTASISAGGASGAFAFSTASPSCAPAPVSYSSWIDVDETAFDGVSGEVSFSVEPNPTTNSRSGTIRLGDHNFTITQTGGACGYSLNAYSANFGRAGGDGAVLGSPAALGCVPTVGTDQPTFIDLGALMGPDSNIFRLNFSIAPFELLTPATRFGHVTFGGQIVTVKQKSY